MTIHVAILAPVAGKNDLRICAEALISLDRAYLRAHPRTPSLYQAGVRYHVEEDGRENWLAIPYILARGMGDCEDLACWRVAELREKGIYAIPRFTKKGHLWHVTVFNDGQIEDPSRKLGMGSE